jgi:hypothetical protein
MLISKMNFRSKKTEREIHFVIRKGTLMSNNKMEKLWFINIISFVLFMVLALTGLIDWLLIPGGYRGEGGFMISIKHFLRGIHEWSALLFIVVVVVHLIMHWSYIKSNLKKHGILK